LFPAQQGPRSLHLLACDHALAAGSTCNVRCPRKAQAAAAAGVMPIEIILAVTKAFVFVMPMFSAGDVQKRLEASLLRVVKTIVERLCCISEFF
jgi:hypothetical protein